MELPRERLLIAALAGAVALVAVTGVAMALPYDADPAAAHASSASIPSFLRSAHAWSASLALALALALTFAMFLAGCYARATMVGAVAGVGLLLAAFESGAVLPWDERAWEAWLHVRDGAGLFGIAPGSADDPSSAPLGLVFGAHVALGIAVAALAAWAVRRFSETDTETETDTGARRPVSLSFSVAVSLALALALAVALPATLGPAPVAGLAVSRPHWPFLWLVPMQETFDERGLLALPFVLLISLAFAWRQPSSRPVRVGLTLALMLVLSLLTLLGGRP